MKIGATELLFIIVIVVFLFGANRIPRLMGDVAKGINAFKKGLGENDEKSSVASAEKIVDTEEVKK